jgi:hypothetical protein
MGLVENTTQRPDGNLCLPWHDDRIHSPSGASNEFYVAAFLTCLHKAVCLQPALDFPIRLRLKPSQPRPRPFVVLGGEWLAAARSEAPAPPLGLPELPPPFHLGLQRRYRDTEKRTSFLRAKPVRKTIASPPRFCHTGRAYPRAPGWVLTGFRTYDPARTQTVGRGGFPDSGGVEALGTRKIDSPRPPFDQYQQTRGTLAMLAQWISWAFAKQHQDQTVEPLLTVGSAPLHVPAFRAAVLGQLGETRRMGYMPAT